MLQRLSARRTHLVVVGKRDAMPLIPLLFPSPPSSAFTLSPPHHSLTIAGASGLCRCLANFASFPFDTITTRYVGGRGFASVYMSICLSLNLPTYRSSQNLIQLSTYITMYHPCARMNHIGNKLFEHLFVQVGGPSINVKHASLWIRIRNYTLG